MRKIAIALLLLAFLSCKKEESLQQYMVEKSYEPEFVSFDLSSSMLNMKSQELTDEQKRTLKAVRKINVLGYKKDSLSKVNYADEARKVKKLLKAEEFQELMHVNSGADGGSVSFVGTEQDIDEIILFASDKKYGFAVIRIIGEDMDSTTMMDILSLIRQSDIGIEQFQPIKKLMEPAPFLMH